MSLWQKTTMLIEQELTGIIINCAIEVHKHLGPGLLESAYEICLVREFHLRNIQFERQKKLPLDYKGIKLPEGYRIDLVVDDRVIIEVKSVNYLLPIHEAQLLTYLKLSKIKVGLLINFNTAVLIAGIKRMVL